MTILMWVVFQFMLLLLLNFMQFVINPSTYVGMGILNICVTGCVILLFVILWKTDWKIKDEISMKMTVKGYISYIIMGIGLCLAHRIVFIIFPQIAIGMIEQIGIENYMSQNNALVQNPIHIIYFGVIGPLLEELFYRGKLLNQCLKKIKPVFAVILISVLFGISHMNPVQFVSAFLMGLLCGYTYIKSRDIKVPILIHMANNLFSLISGVLMNYFRITQIGMTAVIGSIILGFGLLIIGLKMAKSDFTIK